MTVDLLDVKWDLLGADEACWLRSWLSSRTPGPITVEEVWRAMDRAWEDTGCGGRRPDPSRLEAFYRHPVWTLNGLFVRDDPASRGIRGAIARCLAELVSPGALILDYGGGFGALAAMARDAVPGSRVDILDPFPSPAAREILGPGADVRFVAAPEGPYDAVLCTDVLEHLTDPVAALAGIVSSLRPGGILIAASNFYPVMRCHLPATFHLRLTFRAFAWLCGLARLGPCEGSHAAAYRRKESAPVPMVAARILEAVSRAAFPVLRWPHALYWRLRRGGRRAEGAR